MSKPFHNPVLLTETLDLLNLRTDAPACRQAWHVIDCTLGLGGHSLEILKRIGPKGKLMVFEQDENNLNIARRNLKDYESQIIYIHDNFETLAENVKKHQFAPVHAILMDLGLSSPHVDDPERGFSFMKEGPLDMRFDPRQQLTAEHIVNHYSERELADIFFHYGEEKWARSIARKIVEAREKKPIRTTTELAELIKSSARFSGKINPATLTFQALRIAVNREIEVLEKTLDQAVQLLAPNGRIAVISYHSLEDRVVKNKFRFYTRECICPKELPLCQCNFQKSLYLITKKPIIPSGIEVSGNPRSRSAKLRVAEKR
ncbi:MAG: 16S rRNA (cytosine(1402)-N(4))-methyltransferase RsmH [Candidatus Peregrinibacteria bacterium]